MRRMGTSWPATYASGDPFRGSIYGASDSTLAFGCSYFVRMPSQPLLPDPKRPSVITEGDVEAVLAEFGGDARAAIRALLQDLDILARDYAATVSHGYVRGEIPRLVLPGRGL